MDLGVHLDVHVLDAADGDQVVRGRAPACAASPSVPCGTESVSDPSAPVKMLVFAGTVPPYSRVSVTATKSMQNVGCMRTRSRSRGRAISSCAGGRDRELVADQGLVGDHRRSRKPLIAPLSALRTRCVVEPADERRPALRMPCLGEVGDAPRRDLLERPGSVVIPRTIRTPPRSLEHEDARRCSSVTSSPYVKRCASFADARQHLVGRAGLQAQRAQQPRDRRRGVGAGERDHVLGGRVEDPDARARRR